MLLIIGRRAGVFVRNTLRPSVLGLTECHSWLSPFLSEERLWLPQRGGVSVCGADVDRGPNPAVAETPGAGLPVSRDRSPSVRPSRSAITGPGRGLNGYPTSFVSEF